MDAQYMSYNILYYSFQSMTYATLIDNRFTIMYVIDNLFHDA